MIDQDSTDKCWLDIHLRAAICNRIVVVKLLSYKIRLEYVKLY